MTETGPGNMRPLWAAFLSLLLPGALVHALVPAPENVTVRCGDQRPVVSWDYRPQQLTNFNVHLLGSGQRFSAQTVDHELNLSDFVWNSSEQMFNYLYVAVTAEQGLNQSKPSESPSFSYNLHKTVAVTCNLKFPPVTLTVEGAEATVSFENPLHFYKELRTIKDYSKFDITIIIAKRSEHDRACGQTPVCKFSVNLPEDAEPCVNLSGVIGHGNYGQEQISVQLIGPVCATATTDLLWVVAVVIFVLFIVLISLITFGVCKTRAWDLTKIPTPQTLALNLQNPTLSMHQSETVYSSVQITGTRPRTIEDPESPCPESSHRVQEDEDRVLIPPPDLCEDQDESAESTKTETLSLHSSSSEIEVSNYERRHPVEVDMGGDMVTGYTS